MTAINLIYNNWFNKIFSTRKCWNTPYQNGWTQFYLPVHVLINFILRYSILFEYILYNTIVHDEWIQSLSSKGIYKLNMLGLRFEFRQKRDVYKLLRFAAHILALDKFLTGKLI